MRTNMMNTRRSCRWLAAATVILSASLISGVVSAQEQRHQIVVKTSTDSDGSGGDDSSGSQVGTKQIVIRDIESDDSSQAAKKLAWLGVAVQEVPEALSSQLELKSGEGLLVTYASHDSPADKAGLQKNDVLVEFDGQMLVDPIQLRKLVQMHQEGDSVKVTFYRGGKKQTTTARLILKSWSDESVDMESLQDGMRKLEFRTQMLPGRDDLQAQMKVVAHALAQTGLDRKKMDIEIRRTLEQTRKAIGDAVRNAGTAQGQGTAMSWASNDLADLAGAGVDVNHHATVVIKNDNKSTRTIVRTDDTGSYVIVADPKKYLTVHDEEGRLLFDGPIDSHEQQQKVPRDIWQNVKPLLDQMDGGKTEMESSEMPSPPEPPAAAPEEKSH